MLQRIWPEHSTLLTPHASPRPAGVNRESLNNFCEVSKHLLNAQPLSSMLHKFSYSLFSEKGLNLPLLTFPDTFSFPPVRCQCRHPSSRQHAAAAGCAVTAPQLRREPARARGAGTALARAHGAGTALAHGCWRACAGTASCTCFIPKNQPNHTLALLVLSRHKSPRSIRSLPTGFMYSNISKKIHNKGRGWRRRRLDIDKAAWRDFTASIPFCS